MLTQYKNNDTIVNEDVKEVTTIVKFDDSNMQQVLRDISLLKRRMDYLERENRRLKEIIQALA